MPTGTRPERSVGLDSLGKSHWLRAVLLVVLCTSGTKRDKQWQVLSGTLFVELRPWSCHFVPRKAWPHGRLTEWVQQMVLRSSWHVCDHAVIMNGNKGLAKRQCIRCMVKRYLTQACN